MKKITILVPAYNEEESLPFLYERVSKIMNEVKDYEFELLFVNDGSKDNTLNEIKKLRDQGATIVYTTHYMEEVEQICTKIVIIDNGKVIASGTKQELKNLISTGEKITITIDNITDEIISKMSSLKNVLSVNKENENLCVTYKKGEENLTGLIEFLKLNNIKYSRIFSELPSLNDVFLELTGKGLRD